MSAFFVTEATRGRQLLAGLDPRRHTASSDAVI
jgi:hypothetical protein